MADSWIYLPVDQSHCYIGCGVQVHELRSHDRSLDFPLTRILWRGGWFFIQDANSQRQGSDMHDRDGRRSYHHETSGTMSTTHFTPARQLAVTRKTFPMVVRSRPQ